MRMNGKVALFTSASVAMAVLVACSDTSTAPSAKARTSTISFNVGDVVSPTPAPVLGKIFVCKAGNANGSFDVTRVAIGASTGTTSGLNTAINTGQCKEVANDFGGDQVGSNVTIDEDPAANTVQAVTTCTFQAFGQGPTSCSFTDGGTVFLNSFHAYVITYTNTFTPPPPPPGNEGCTPGYWKQDQHFDSYPAGITPNTLFSSIFGSGGTLTFLQALGLNGGDINALRRHAAAGYLNALSSGVDYFYTTTQVIAIYNGTGAFAGLTIEERKNLLEAANNGVGGCPLN